MEMKSESWEVGRNLLFITELVSEFDIQNSKSQIPNPKRLEFVI